MSGFEIAGIVLGAIPLILEAVKYYETSASQRFIFFKAHGLLKLQNQLLYIRVSYSSSIELILRGITTNDEQVQLLSEADCPLWKSDDLRDRIQHKLGPRYSVMMHQIREIQRGLEHVAKALSLIKFDENAKQGLHEALLAYPPVVGSDTKNPRFDFKERLKLVLKGKALEELIEKLKSSDRDLDLLVRKADALAEPAEYTQRVSFLGSPESIEKRANTLYSALQNAWTCRNHPVHHLNLLLDPRMAKLYHRPRFLSKDRETVFELIIQDDGSPSLWRSVEMTVSDEEQNLASANSRVRFNVPATRTVSQVVVDDFCAAMAKCNINDIVSFNVDDYGEMRKRQASDCQRQPWTGKCEALEELLSSGSVQISDEDRQAMVATIASSFLQLHRTSWTLGELTKQNIFFLVTPDASAPAQSGPSSHKGTARLKLRKPFIRYLNDPLANHVHGATRPSAPARNDERSMLSLATVLLEVRLGRTIDHPQTNDRVKNLLCLEEWMLREQGKITPGMDKAVRFCMGSWYARRETTSREARQAFLDGVLSPIFKELIYSQTDPLIV